MKTTFFLNKNKDACRQGRDFAMRFETMNEVWDACERPDWLLWILERQKPLEKEQAVRLAIAFAEMSISNWGDENDLRPKQAIQAAKNWLENPTEENQSAAEFAARSAEFAAWSAVEWEAESAAWSAAQSAWSAAGSAVWSAAELAAESAVWSAAGSAEWKICSEIHKQQCDIIRELIPNPFK